MPGGMSHSVRPTKERVAATLEVIDFLTTAKGRVSLTPCCATRDCHKATCRCGDRYFTFDIQAHIPSSCLRIFIPNPS
jgi:hypothetical protein